MEFFLLSSAFLHIIFHRKNGKIDVRLVQDVQYIELNA